MEANKVLLGVMSALGIILIITSLGIFGALNIFDDAKEDPLVKTDHPGEIQVNNETSTPVPEPVTQVQPAQQQPTPQVSTPPITTPSESPTIPQVEPPKELPKIEPPQSTSPMPKPVIQSQPSEPKKDPRRGIPEIGYYTFDRAEEGALPSGWTALKGDWSVLVDPNALPGTGKNVLYQSGIPKEKDDAIVLSNDSIMKNVKVSISMKISDKRTNQTAGVIFRYEDPEDYYSAGLDTLNQRVTLFKTIAGTTRIIAFSTTNRIHPQEWNYLEATTTDDHIQIKLNDNTHISFRDTALSEGKSGIWTMGSTSAVFDNAEIKRLN